jgi:hypothetical protein
MIDPPAKRPCGFCPYRRDAPSGIWSREEYEKLPEYDKPTAYQPPQVFMCHQNAGTLCAGWVGVHDTVECLGLRFVVSFGMIEDVDAVYDYTTDVPLFGSGEEAARHGLAELEHPGVRACKAVVNLKTKRRIKS